MHTLRLGPFDLFDTATGAGSHRNALWCAVDDFRAYWGTSSGAV